MVNDEWSGAEALENAFRVADEELRKVERERDEALEASALFQRDVHEWRTRAKAAERERDAAEYAEAEMERERDEWKARAEKVERERDDADQRCAVAESERDRWKLHHDRVDGQWAKAEREVTQLRAMEQARAEAAEARTAVTREDVDDAVRTGMSGLSAMLAEHSLREAADAVCALFGVEAEPADPVSEKAREIAKGIGWDWDVLDDEHVEIMRSVAAHVLGRSK